MKLLIVEDEKSLSRSICEYMKMEGHICEFAHSYKEAVFKTADNHYNCIILDIGLPDGNGLDVIRHMKEIKSTDGILILSARSSLEDKLTGLKIGADDYLTKPFYSAELLLRVKNLIDQRKKLREKFGKEITLEPKDITVTSTDEKFLTRVLEIVEKNVSNENFSAEDLLKMLE